MTEKFHITQFDLFFLSYDEPNAEKNWSDLIDKAPWAKRVHGVKGFDAAHRECGRQSETPWLITVDADNQVMPEFFDIEIELDEKLDLNKSFTWNAESAINGLMYGNGGVKLWSKEFVSKMSCHELSDGNQGVDFCWEDNYFRLGKTFSIVYNNTTPYQAFRVGFREGVKLALDRGVQITPQLISSSIHEVNLRNLKIWCSVGADVANGSMAILGARMGLLAHLDKSFAIESINDYSWFADFWNKSGLTTADPSEITNRIAALGDQIYESFRIELPVLDAKASKFFRESMALRND